MSQRFVLARIHTMISMKMSVFCLLSFLVCLSVALEAKPASGNGMNEYFDYITNSYSLQNLPQKRYTYGSEYKRLPVYNFGIGKRARPYEFGVGKRSKTYSFGVGKRFNYDDQPLNYVLDAAYESNPKDNVDNQSQFKRGPSQRFSFGVGKRESTPATLNSDNSANNIKKPKNDSHDTDIYDIYDLLRKLNNEIDAFA